MLKLLHTADWQIGRSYGRFDGEDAAALAAARIEGVKRIAQIANEHKVDAVLVAGDVFDSQTPRDKTVARLFEALAGFDAPWLMLPGNHDAALPESVWEFAKRMDGVVPSKQVGIIARFAYADLLKETGKPTLLMLDDSLVNCDLDRLAQMKRVIYDAAKRHQILIFTCHGEKWQDMGVAPITLQ